MAQNGRTSLLQPDSEGRAPVSSNGAAQYLDAARRRDRLVRRESARRAGTFTVDSAVLEANGYTKDDTEKAAQFLCDSIKAGRVSLAQVEHDQVEDASRLSGWMAVGPPPPGSATSGVVAAIQHRMAVRNRALELHNIYDLQRATDQSRPQTVPGQPKWKPWRPGAAPGGTGY